MSHYHPSRILYVDDDVEDCHFLREYLTESGSATDLVCANDGEEAIRYLNALAEGDAPSLIVLDLNMPRWDGKKTLGYIKAQPRLAHIPVVILSTSDNRFDKDACQGLGAATYLTKPYHMDGYREIISRFLTFLPAPEA